MVLWALLPASVDARTFTAEASWYGEWHHGRTMANGEPFDMHDPTIAAHRTLPFGTQLRITNPATKISQVVVIKDRGPYTDDPGRALDLSKAAADRLGFTEDGVASLKVSIINP
jgi:rare lipoprotein A